MSNDEKEPEYLREMRIGYWRKRGEDNPLFGVKISSAADGIVFLVFLIAWVVGSTLFGFSIGYPGPFLVLDAMIILPVISALRS